MTPPPDGQHEPPTGAGASILGAIASCLAGVLLALLGVAGCTASPAAGDLAPEGGAPSSALGAEGGGSGAAASSAFESGGPGAASDASSGVGPAGDPAFDDATVSDGTLGGDPLADSSSVDGALQASGDDDATTDPDAGVGDGCAGLFCEDFERGVIDTATWNVQTSGGQTVVVQSTTVAHGKYAAQFHANPNIESYDFIITKNAPAALQGHHFGRAYFNVSPKPPVEHTEFLFAGTAGFPKLKYLEVAGIGAAWQLTFVDLVTNVESYASGGTLPDAQWICLEWEFNDTPDQATVFVDGAQSYARTSITSGGQTTGLVGGFAAFGFGYYAWHPATYAFDVYYDDIVLDVKRVGCLSP
jgi:hypothetical protein